MAWITPKTDWLETDHCTYEDMNRIAGNVNEVCGISSLKADYTQDDVVTLAELHNIITALETMAELAGYTSDETLTELTTADSYNTIESFTLGLKNWIDLLLKQASAKIYVGDDIYIGEGQHLR